MYLEICLIIFGIAIFLLAIFCIPILIQIWRTTKNVAFTLEALNQNLPAILKNLEEITTNMEEITTNINNSTSAIDREVQNFSDTIGRFQSVIKDIVDDIQYITPMVLKTSAFQTVKNTIAVVKGIRVFLDVFFAKK